MHRSGPSARIGRPRRLRIHCLCLGLLGLGCLAWSVLATAGPGTSEPPRFDRLEHFTTRDGLSANWILSIYQDRQGFLWIGTDDGLNRYDGYQFKIFRHDPEDAQSLSDNFVTCIYEDRLGQIWYGTRNGLNRLDRIRGTFTRFHHDPDRLDSLGADFITDIQEDRHGTLWISTLDGLHRFERPTQSFTRLHHDPEDESSLSSSTVIRILLAKNGELWVGTGDGVLHRFDPQTLHFTRHPLHNGEETLFWRVVEDAAGQLWITVRPGVRLIRFDPETGMMQKLSLAIDATEIEALLPKSDGTLWLGTTGGLAIFHPRTQTYTLATHDPNVPGSLSHNRVFRLYEDRTGVTWLGTDEGLDKFVPSREKFSLLEHQTGDPQSLSADLVSAVMEDRQGLLWIGTAGDGLNRLDRSRGVNTRYRHDPGDINSLSSDEVWSFLEDSRDRLWIGLSGGVDRFDPETGRFLHSGADLETPMVGRVQGLAEAADGTIWATDDSALFHLDADGRWLGRYPVIDEPDTPLQGVPTLLQDRRGSLWIGTDFFGLARFDPDQESFTRFRHDPDDPNSLSQDKILSLLEDRSGRLWIGTHNGTLNRLDPTAPGPPHFTRYDAQDGLSTGQITGILEDDEGGLWLSSSKGLTRFDPERRASQSFDAGDGPGQDAYSWGAAWRSSSGELFFGGTGGLTSFTPEGFEKDPHPPQVAITDFLLFNRSASFADYATGGSQQPNEVPELELSHRDYVFAFEFSALHFKRPDKIQYQYQLEGFDRDWVATDSSRRFAQYSNLAPGSYVFRVKAANPDGLWSSDDAAVRVRVLPPPWKTWWAYTLYGLTLASGIWVYVRSQQRQLERQRQATAREREVSARLREVDKLKDEFLAERTSELTERNRLLEERERLIRQLETTNTELARFNYTVAHDLRNPLVTIKTFIGRLHQDFEENDGDRMRQDLKRIGLAADYLQRLLDELYSFSRVERPRGPGQLVAIGKLVNESLEQLAGQISERAVEVDVADNLPMVPGDPVRLGEVMRHLLANALSYLGDQPAPRIEIGTRKADYERIVYVRDNGLGIAPRYHEKIFELFQRLDPKASDGTGIGLALVKRIIEVHGGRVWVESDGAGTGSTFCFALPPSDAPANAEGKSAISA